MQPMPIAGNANNAIEFRMTPKEIEVCFSSD
jgi:hypothetical protein